MKVRNLSKEYKEYVMSQIREISPLQVAVVSVGSFHSGD